MKAKAGKDIGVRVQHIKLPKTVTEKEVKYYPNRSPGYQLTPDFLKVISTIHGLNISSDIHGVMLQLPIDSVAPIDENLCTNKIAPDKDVDG